MTVPDRLQFPLIPYTPPAGSLDLDELNSTHGFAGLALPVATGGHLLRGESIIGFDDRTRITVTGSFPWRTIVRLAVRWTPSGGLGACSGALVGDYHVLTAGHCVFDYGGTNDWAYSIQVLPGLVDDDMPYNHAWATRLHSYSGWVNSGLTSHDWAVLALDRSVGTFTGWMGRQTASSTSGIYLGTKNVAGYPGTPSGNATCPNWANCQYWDADEGYAADEYHHWHWMDTSGGMSGGPVWRYLSSTGDRFILTTHTCGTGGCGKPLDGTNHGTRLNNDKYNRIDTWISGDSDIAPDDRADLIDEPGDGSQTSDRTPTFDWGSVGGANSYRLQVDDGQTFSSPIIDVTTGTSNYTPASDLADGTYYWRVRADKSCGTDGDWSVSYSFTVASGGGSTSCDLHQVSNTTIGGTATHGACRELRSGPSLTISATGNATLEAGTRVVLCDGFRIETGGSLTITTCGHSLCSAGPPFDMDCHSCVTSICTNDPFCCTSGWDTTCVNQVASVCGLTCP